MTFYYIGSEEKIDMLMDLLWTGQAYLAQCGVVNSHGDGVDMSTYKFSHWIYRLGK